MKSNNWHGIREWALVVSVALGLAGCLGGGSSGGGSGSGSSSTSPPVSGNPPPAAAQNVLPLSVNAGPASTINIPFISVTICVPGTSNCQTIDHVIVDTGSSGLRIMSSVLNHSLALTQTAANGSPLVECMQFADGYAWGPVKAADVKLGGETINALPLQVIGDPGYPTAPRSCSSSGPSENTVQSFGGNGIIGLSAFQQDCGSSCAQMPISGTYYSCSTSTSCQSVALDTTRQLQNPVALLSNDNNGVIIDLPAVNTSGAATVNGSLILGIGTQSNNALGTAVVYTLDPNYGTLNTMFHGQGYANSFIDSGSNGNFFPDGTTPVCSSGFYCPATLQQLTATNFGANGSTGTVNFSVGNADTLLSSSFTAFSSLAGPTFGSPSFDWGLPFHFGRRVFTAIEGMSTTGGTGPFVAY